MCKFGHLHTHSEYSTLDGMGKIKELLDTAKELGQTFISITDHGSTSGLWEAQKYGDEIGIKVIPGIEFYYQRENDNKNGHLLVLAKNNKGLENIFKMQEIASVHNFYRKPRINWDILKAHHEGLIVTSACLGSTFNQYLMSGNVVEAKAWARKFQEVFGEDFYIELQPNSIPEQHICNLGSIRIAKQLGIKLVATNDVHYTFETDCFPHEVLLALQLNNKMSDEKRFKFSTNDFWLKSEEEMYETFDGLDAEIVQEAINTTREIADKCSARIEKGKFLPRFYDTQGKSERELLVEWTMEGAKARGLSRDKNFMKDVQNEIDVIDRNGYSGYFLVVSDFVKSAKDRGDIVGDGRGSGAGSKVAYLTRITEIPPHEFDLLFERFMADGRSPDFDVDFSDQDAVFEDLQRKYGIANVARIIAFGKMTPKACIRKVLNAFEIEPHIIGGITKLVPDLCKSLEDAYKVSPELLDYKKKYHVEWEVIERLENVISHESQHAGGVIIYPNLSSILPVKTQANDRNKRIVAWDKYMLEELGHYKFDILGLETLPVVRNTLISIEKSTGEKIDLSKIDLEDPNVYDMLCLGDVSGVFQLANQSSKVIEQQPRNFRDLIAINALIRPGVGDWNEYLARRKGKEWSVYHPRMPYMNETVGTMTYQEQFLLDAHTLAGWDIAYADKHIRKNKSIRTDEGLRTKFLEDCLRNGHPQEEIEKVWSDIESAVDGGYSFNKSHSASYAMLSYQTAYLKHYYPNHFYASLMSSEKTDGDGQNAIASYIAECKQRGIAILPPNINRSGDTYTASDDGINYRITTIKHVGESAIQHLLDLRPVSSFEDFLVRRDTRHAKKNVVINLIKAGCFDFDNPNRAELLWKFDMSLRTKTQIKNDYQCPTYEWNDKIKAEWEKEVLGMYLSVHPMERYGFRPLDTINDGATGIQGGEVVSVYEFHPQKNPQKPKMAFITINTLFGTVKCISFASTWMYQNIREAFETGNLVLVRGKRSGNDFIVDGVEVL